MKLLVDNDPNRLITEKQIKGIRNKLEFKPIVLNVNGVDVPFDCDQKSIYRMEAQLLGWDSVNGKRHRDTIGWIDANNNTIQLSQKQLENVRERLIDAFALRQSRLFEYCQMLIAKLPNARLEDLDVKNWPT